MTPPDIMERARELCSLIAEHGHPAEDAIAAAILAERERERERCARIADAYSECERDCGDVLAHAIRGGTPNG